MVTWTTSCHIPSSVLVFSGSWLHFFLFAFEPVPPALCMCPTTERFITGQGHVSAEVAGSPEFTFLSSHMSFLSWHGKSN